jgi:hypothetical protein
MGPLRTEGFDKLLENVAEEAAAIPAAGPAIRHLAGIGGRLASEVALGALRSPEHYLLDAAESAGAVVDAAAGAHVDAYRFGYTTPGKACILSPGQDPGDIRIIAGIGWPSGVSAALAAEAARLDRLDRAETEACRAWLADKGEEYALELVRHLRFIFEHVGPIRLYVGNACYTNLGKRGNLVGKSVARDSDRCRMKVLAETPLTGWSATDACFVVCMSALIGSGTPSRTEEFSGTQMLPGRLRRFLEGRVRAYAGEVPVPLAGESPIGTLFELSELVKKLRAEKLASGAAVYRTVQAMTLNKKEHFFASPVTGADLPEAFVDTLAEFVPASVDHARGAESAGFEVDWSGVFDGDRPPSEPAFGSRFGEVLHRLVEAATEATGSDVGMSRGPRDIPRLSALLAEGSHEPGHWGTGEYYCCVVPAAAFRARMSEAGAAADVQKVVRAVAARMRWNCWHFMPHGADLVDAPSFAERDWFFAPSMPDMTEWTSHHHQGHVANGVRHAIRVPFGITLAGEFRPGVHDLRLMRTEGAVYEVADLRAAVAMGEILRGFYQRHADRLAGNGEPFVLDDFDNAWYLRRYGLTAPAGGERATTDSSPGER